MKEIADQHEQSGMPAADLRFTRHIAAALKDGSEAVQFAELFARVHIENGRAAGKRSLLDLLRAGISLCDWRPIGPVLVAAWIPGRPKWGCDGSTGSGLFAPGGRL